MFDLIHGMNELIQLNPVGIHSSHPFMETNETTPTSKLFPLL